ncbi:GAF and ANTAR domain-containing protein [Rhodococcus aetherivorans]|uniref:GAF and ANTAR domain-containing protein n=1 Tax=Rhodococcus aetherivorans TaxID=191292 RepID=UPI00045CEF0D|nr:GAF and ANTAR domain-containing protein [Rhodococcus aetherivorans]KDE13185.1 RNA-binding protein [Rhodococcus aetherivorans]
MDGDMAGNDPLCGRVGEIVVALRRLSAALDEGDELPELLHLLVGNVVKIVPETGMAGVTVLRGGRPETEACSNPLLYELDHAQYLAGAGPGLDAVRTGQVVRADRAEMRRRWPAFAERAERFGTASSLAAPLRIDDETAGSFNLHSEHDHGFDSLDETLVEVFTTAVETALRQARRCARARAEITQLDRALRSRPTIDHAVGIVMAARGLTAEEAFAVLVRQSQHENVKLRDVAARLVAQLTPAGTDPRPGPMTRDR